MAPIDRAQLETLLAEAKKREKAMRSNYRPRLSRAELVTLYWLLVRKLKDEALTVTAQRKRWGVEPREAEAQEHKKNLRLARKLKKLLYPPPDA